MFVKHNKTIYEVIEAGHWTGLAPAKVQDSTDPVNRWNGGKRTIEQHQQVLAFFEWSFALTKGETMAHWLYSEQDRSWCPIVLPQRGWTGLAVKLLDDHPNKIAAFQRGNGREIMGTDHHHCSSGAFQSNVDHNDEKTKEGLHVTIGGVGTAAYSIDARTSFRNNILPVCLSDWYELPEQYSALPQPIADQILRHLLTRPAPEGTQFPDWWKENVIKEERIVNTWQQGNMGNYVGNYSGDYTVSNSNKNRYGFGRQTMRQDLKEYCQLQDITPERLLEWLEELEATGGVSDIIDILMEQNECLAGAIKDAQAMVEEKSMNELDTVKIEQLTHFRELQSDYFSLE